MGNDSEWIGASDLMQRLEADPEWVAQRDAKEKARLEHVAQYDKDVAPLVKGLLAVGIEVKSEWDLVNSRESYPEAIPVLTDHLERDYRHEIIEGIVRALTVPEARGEPARAILRVFTHSDNQRESVRFAMVNALTVIADSSMVEKMEELLAKERADNIAKFLGQAIAKAKKRKPVS